MIWRVYPICRLYLVFGTPSHHTPILDGQTMTHLCNILITYHSASQCKQGPMKPPLKMSASPTMTQMKPEIVGFEWFISASKLKHMDMHHFFRKHHQGHHRVITNKQPWFWGCLQMRGVPYLATRRDDHPMTAGTAGKILYNRCAGKIAIWGR